MAGGLEHCGASGEDLFAADGITQQDRAGVLAHGSITFLSSLSLDSLSEVPQPKLINICIWELSSNTLGDIFKPG